MRLSFLLFSFWALSLQRALISEAMTVFDEIFSVALTSSDTLWLDIHTHENVAHHHPLSQDHPARSLCLCRTAWGVLGGVSHIFCQLQPRRSKVAKSEAPQASWQTHFSPARRLSCFLDCLSGFLGLLLVTPGVAVRVGVRVGSWGVTLVAEACQTLLFAIRSSVFSPATRRACD